MPRARDSEAAPPSRPDVNGVGLEPGHLGRREAFDGVVKALNVEQPGKFEVSDAETMLKQLR